MGISRGIDSDLVEAMETVFNPTVLVYVDWPTGPVRVHSGVGELSYDGETWLGLGKYGDISIPSENLSLVSSKATLSVGGTLTDMFDQLNANPRNKTVYIYFGCVTEPSGTTLIGEPFKIFTGYIDQVDFDFNKSSESFGTSTVTITVGSGPSARSRATISHGAEDQEAKHPGDTAGRQVINALKKVINPDTWPES